MKEMVWPDRQALLDDFAEYFQEIGQELQIRSKDDLEAGFDRARTAAGYRPDADPAELAALLFDGLATRHPLVDGNKRLAFQAMTVFLDLNDVWFDPPELLAYETVMDVINHRKTVEDLAAFIREHSRPFA